MFDERMINVAKFQKYTVKTTSLLNIREKGSMQSEIVGTIPKGTQVEIVGHSSDKLFGGIAPKKFINLEFTERI